MGFVGKGSNVCLMPACTKFAPWVTLGHLIQIGPDPLFVTAGGHGSDQTVQAP